MKNPTTSPLRILALCTALLFIINLAHAAEYAVVVNPANTYTSSDQAALRQTAKQIFLKQKTSWPDFGEKARPFSFGKKPAQQAFTDKILGMDDASLDQHWLSVKQKTGGSPPRDIPSSSLMAKFVSRYPGAVGVMSVGDAEKHSSDVKILLTYTD